MADISKIKTPDGATYDISVSRNKVGKTNDHWEDGLDPVSQAMILDHSANKTFGLPASQITIEYSTDGGSTWQDYGATDTQKKNLFSETRVTNFYLGKNTTGKTATTNHRLRVTIAHNSERYVELSAVYVWLNISGNTIYMNMEESTNGSPNSFTTVFSGQLVKGWAGADIRYFSPVRFGSPSQSGNANKIRLTFYQTAVNTSYGVSYVQDIRFYGNSVWKKANNMMATNHMYSWDSDMNVTFPAQVTATTFNGTATYANSAYEIRHNTGVVKCGSSAITGGNIVVAGTDGLYKHLKSGTAFDLNYPIYLVTSNISANSISYYNYISCKYSIKTTQSMTLTERKPVYIKGHLNGTVFTPISTAPLTQTVPTFADGCQYIFLGIPYASDSIYIMSDHPIYQFRDGKFALYEELSNDTLDIQKKQYIQQLKDLCLFAEIANGS